MRKRLHVRPLHPVVRFVEVPTARVLKLEVDDGSDVRGSFVKLVPRLRRSERHGFDAAAAVAGLKARGAAVVVAAPVLVPDQKPPVEVGTGVVDARAEVSAWFGDTPSGEQAKALRGALQILDEVGL
jgi:hypothetical protein